MGERNYYMVRAMESREQDFEVFFKNNVVAVGWSNFRFNDFDDNDSLRACVKEEYYKDCGKANSFIGKKVNEVIRFNSIQEGDYIVVPYPGCIALAIAGAEKLFSEKHIEKDMANQRRVSYQYNANGNDILLISRKELSEAFQRRLRTPGMTVSDLSDFKDDIDRLFEQKSSYSYSSEMQRKEDDDRRVLHKMILDNIRNGNTYLQAGGIGLEELVAELMECEGYNAKVLSKTKFTGKADADIEALREDAFSSQRIYVQVKHHSGFSDKTGIQQVIDVINQDEYSECEGYFITSGNLHDETKRYAEENSIRYMVGDDLVELIIDHISDLKVSTLRLLGISPYPHMLCEK